MTRLTLLSLAITAFVAGAALAQDPPKVDPPKTDPAKTDKTDPPKTDPAKTDDPVVINKTSAGDVGGVVSKVTGSQLTLKIPQQVPNGYTTQSVRVPNPAKPGQTHVVRQQVPKFKTVTTESTFNLAEKVAVKTEGGKVVDMTAILPGVPVIAHVTKVKEGKPGEKADTHFEVTRIMIPNQAAPPATGGSGSSGATTTDPKKN